MSTTTTSDGSIIKFEEDEDIYIECRPVDITGEVIIDGSDNMLSETLNNEILDSLSNNISVDGIFSNVGAQIVIGLLLLAILYIIGNFIFKNVPSNIINKKLSSLPTNS